MRLEVKDKKEVTKYIGPIIRYLQKYGEDQALKKGATLRFDNGRSVNYASWVAAYETAKASGKDLKFRDKSGEYVTMSLTEANARFKDFREAAGFEYLQHSEVYNNGTIDQGVRNFEQEAQYTINPTLTAEQFSSHFKGEYNDLRNQYAANVNGDGPNSARTIQRELDDLNNRRQDLATQIAHERVNARGNDGRIDGR